MTINTALMHPRTLRYIVVSALFMIMLVSLYVYSFRPHLYQWPHSTAAVLPMVHCHGLWEPCSLALPKGGQLSIKLSSTSLPNLSPLYIQVSIDDLKTQNVGISFSDFAEQHHQLALIREPSGLFIAKTVVPSSIHSLESIRLSLFITTETMHYRIPFLFRDPVSLQSTNVYPAAYPRQKHVASNH